MNHTEKKVLHFPRRGFPPDFIGFSTGNGFGEFQIFRLQDPVQWGLLHDQTAIDQRLEVYKPTGKEIRQTVDLPDLNDPQIGPFFKKIQGAFLVVGRRHDFEIVLGNEFRGFFFQRAVEHQASAEGGNAVGPIGPVIGVRQGLPICRPTGIVMLQNDRGGLSHEVF
jgi:hypothetical protein